MKATKKTIIWSDYQKQNKPLTPEQKTFALICGECVVEDWLIPLDIFLTIDFSESGMPKTFNSPFEWANPKWTILKPIYN